MRRVSRGEPPEAVVPALPLLSDGAKTGYAHEVWVTIINKSSMKNKVCIIGSGNWGSAIALAVGVNTAAHPDLFERQVSMYCFEELVEGRKLSEIINTTHENVKYLPGRLLPENVVAVPDICEAARGATILVVVTPHQFIGKQLPLLKSVIAPTCHAISLIKGIEFEGHNIRLISSIISESLGGMHCGVLMGANVANEVAQGDFCETTIGVRDTQYGPVLRLLFQTPTFRVNILPDVAGPELAGALKNVVALAVGFVAGLKQEEQWNSKAAIMRLGLVEMQRFAEKFFPGVHPGTWTDSCGIADLVATCCGGRNFRCAREFVQGRIKGSGETMDAVEARLLNGQKLQGTITAKDVQLVLKHYGCQKEFPLFDAVYRIAFEGAPPAETLFEQWGVWHARCNQAGLSISDD